MTQTARTRSRIAHLADSDREDYPHIVHGVAHGADELTLGKNSPKYWPAEEVEAAASTLEGKPIYRGTHSETPEQIGSVLRAAYEDGVGVVYEAGLEDEEVATELSIGQREVSIEASNADSIDRHGDTGAVIMRGYEYTGLATPERGASRANYTSPGPAEQNPAVAALSATDVESALAGDGVDVDAALNAYTSTSGVRYRGTRDGKLDQSEIPNDEYEDHYLFPADTKSSSSYPVVDADGYLRRGNVAAAYSLGPRGGVSRDGLYEKLRPLNDAFSTPPVAPEKLRPGSDGELAAGDLAVDAAVLAAAEAALAPTDDPTGARSSGRDAETTEGTMSDPDNNTDHDIEALLERVDEKDERIASLESDLEATEAELEEKEAQIEQMEESLAEAKRDLAARLAEHDPLNDEDDYVERYDIAELREKASDLDDLDDGDADPDVQSGSGSGAASAQLADEEAERIEEIEAKLSRVRGALPQSRIEELEAEAAELAGTDDYEAALEAI